VKVAEINSQVSSIAASVQEQATGLHQVNTAVNQMDQVTHQNAAMVEETTAAAQSLSRETEELAHLICSFRTVENVNVEPIRRAQKPAPSARPTSATRSALKSVAGRRAVAVRKAEPAKAAGAWEEF
jgi:methyl-accepting chemotaxis protein